jgi:hypothetical protein
VKGGKDEKIAHTREGNRERIAFSFDYLKNLILHTVPKTRLLQDFENISYK